MTNQKRAIILLVLMGIAAYLGLNLYISQHRSHAITTTTIATDHHIGGSFRLIDQDQEVQTEALLKKKWSLVFFGYSYCPDVCPLTLQTLGRAQTLLGAKAKDTQIIFITVDPRRDTPSALKAYLASNGFPKGVIGLTGSEKDIQSAAKAYGVTYEKVGKGDDYTMNHTALIFLMDPKGQFKAPLGQDLGPEKTAQLITSTMEEGY